MNSMKQTEPIQKAGIPRSLLARSKAGHDKGQLYVIVGADADRYYGADGKSKTVARPKSKNKKHMQPIHFSWEELLPDLRSTGLRDEDVKYVLKQYQKADGNHFK